MNKLAIAIILMAIVTASIILVTSNTYSNSNAYKDVVFRTTIKLVDKKSKPVSGAKVFVYTLMPDGPSRIVAYGYTDKHGLLHLKINMTGVIKKWIKHLVKRMLGKYMPSLIIDIYYNKTWYPGYTILLDPSWKGIVHLAKTIKLPIIIKQEATPTKGMKPKPELIDGSIFPALVDWYVTTMEVPLIWIKNCKGVVSNTSVFVEEGAGARTRIAIAVLGGAVSFVLGECVQVTEKHLLESLNVAESDSEYLNIIVKVVWEEWQLDLYT